MAGNNHFGFAYGGGQYRPATFPAAAAGPTPGAYAAGGVAQYAVPRPVTAAAQYSTIAGYAMPAHQPMAPPTYADYSTDSAYQRAAPAYQTVNKATGFIQPVVSASYTVHSPDMLAGTKVTIAYSTGSYQSGGGARVTTAVSHDSAAAVAAAAAAAAGALSSPSAYSHSYSSYGSSSTWQKGGTLSSNDSFAYPAAPAAAPSHALSGPTHIISGGGAPQLRTWRSAPRPGLGSSPASSAPAAASSAYTPPAARARPMASKFRSSAQLHYCDVCRISCAGPQTYREHLEGQKHKKRAASLKQHSSGVSHCGRTLRCELCDVLCTGSDAYAAHVRGTKHVKVLKLHTKLGKPIPSSNPMLVTPESSSKTGGSTTKTADSTAKSADNSAKKESPSPAKTAAAASAGAKSVDTSTAAAATDKTSSSANTSDLAELRSAAAAVLGEKEIEPVGQEYIEMIKDEQGKLVTYNCKLCDCRFNDPNADQMHAKGRRHRLQYKKKVNPALQVDVKPVPGRQRRSAERPRSQKSQRSAANGAGHQEAEPAVVGDLMAMEAALPHCRDHDAPESWFPHAPIGGPPHAMRPTPLMAPARFGFPVAPPMMHRVESFDDRMVMAKHADIYPRQACLAKTQKVICSIERALKLVSDEIAESEETQGTASGTKQEVPRVLKGVMRVGILAKGLLLRDDSHVQLVLLCSDKPTRSLLERVAHLLPKHLTVVYPDGSLTLQLCVESAALQLTASPHPLTVSVTLTCSLIRSPATATAAAVTAAESPAAVADAPDALDKHQCLLALAALRHAKWFQARACGLQSCVIVIRILRDLRNRLPVWKALSEWSLELLVERVLVSARVPLMPAEALRHVLEAVAGGLLLPLPTSSAPGLLDPCEKQPTDTLADLKPQQREDITASAQRALRLMAFRQLHRLLDCEPTAAAAATRGSAPGSDSHSAGTATSHQESATTTTTAVTAAAAAGGTVVSTDSSSVSEEPASKKIKCA